MDSGSAQRVVGAGIMIVPPKRPAVQLTFRWPSTLLDRIKRIAERSGRSQNAAGERLIEWSLSRAEAELEEIESLGDQQEQQAAAHRSMDEVLPVLPDLVPVKFRWDPDLIARVKRVADRTGRTVTGATLLLMEWSVSRAEAEFAELEAKGTAGREQRRKK